MSPTPSSTPSSVGAPEEQFRVVRRRNRIPLSCYHCRSKKKCDRGHPCSNCVRRDGSGTSSCSYASPTSRKKGLAQKSDNANDMQSRIDRLENLVLSLMHNGSPVDAEAIASVSNMGIDTASASTRTNSGGLSANTQDRDNQMATDDDDEKSDVDDGLANSLGMLKVDVNLGKSLYIGQEHWHSILADLAEVKNYFIQNRHDVEKGYERVMQSKSAASREAPTLLRGAEPASADDLLAELPAKSTVLTLCGRYFNSMDSSVNIIHAPTFNAQLRSHWQDPTKTPITWLGLLYSILCLAMLSYQKVGDEPPEWKGRVSEMASLFRVRTVQCLATADYTRPAEYTVETMILYVFGENLSRWDAELGLWLISALITRVAFRMGYHRDAKWFPSITPFQAEMRRRTWALVRMCDVLLSHQVSLPNMIYDHDCDTQMPHNIFDEEFGIDTKVLPPSRPTSEPTPISFMIVKYSLTLQLSKILQLTSRVGKPPSYDDILFADKELRQIKADLPDHLKMRPLGVSQDPLSLVIARFNIDILYQKIMCLLHHKYMSRARLNPRYNYSLRTAVQASVDTLHHLQALYKESHAEGRLQSIKWYVASIATKDFLMPAMVVALEVHHNNLAMKEGRIAEVEQFWTPEQYRNMLVLLETARDIWKPLSDGSMEAFKAYNILRVVIEKLALPTNSPNTGAPGPSMNGQGAHEGVACVMPNASRTTASTDTNLPSNISPPVAPLELTPSLLSAATVTTGNGAATLADAPFDITTSMDPVSTFGTSTQPQDVTYTAPFNILDQSLIEDTEMEANVPLNLYSSLTGINGAGGLGNSMSANLFDDMDFSNNFDWDALQAFTQGEPYKSGVDQMTSFAGGEEQPLGVAYDSASGTHAFPSTRSSGLSDPALEASIGLSTGPSTRPSTGPPADPSFEPSTGSSTELSSRPSTGPPTGTLTGHST